MPQRTQIYHISSLCELGPDEFERVLRLYQANNYKPRVNPADVILVAESRGEICGIVRLCEE
jgi:hypothetical protein